MKEEDPLLEQLKEELIRLQGKIARVKRAIAAYSNDEPVKVRKKRVVKNPEERSRKLKESWARRKAEKAAKAEGMRSPEDQLRH